MNLLAHPLALAATALRAVLPWLLYAQELVLHRVGLPHVEIAAMGDPRLVVHCVEAVFDRAGFAARAALRPLLAPHAGRAA